ncbi:DUF4398 domain-containing protein [bacterium]|nr:DUF4398 domain-containing protein [bacterium]NBX81782.1 DUF4398 domain-containing protein [bacterium]
MRSVGIILLFVGVISACHPRPIEDMILADVALKAAQKVKAEVLAPDTYRRAENLYLRAKKDFTEGYYESAKKFAHEARQIAEQAEYQSVAKQTELKGGFVEPESAPSFSAPIPEEEANP